MLQFMGNRWLKSPVLDFLNDTRKMLVILFCGSKTQNNKLLKFHSQRLQSWQDRLNAEITINSSVIGRHYMLNRGTIPHRSLLILMGKSQCMFFRCFPLILAQGSMDLSATLVSFSLQQKAPVVEASWRFPSCLSNCSGYFVQNCIWQGSLRTIFSKWEVIYQSTFARCSYNNEILS